MEYYRNTLVEITTVDSRDRSFKDILFNENGCMLWKRVVNPGTESFTIPGWYFFQ